MMEAGELGVGAEEVERAMRAIETLAGEIGPRAPTSEAEAAAGEWLRTELEALGLEPRVDEFPAYRSFGRFYLPLFGLALVAALPRRVVGGMLLGGAAAAFGYREGEFRSWGPATELLPGRSRNVWAVIEPRGEPLRTVCLVSHLDSSRSGLMFHPRLRPYLGRILAVVSGAVGLNAVAPLLEARGGRPGRLLARTVRAILAAALALVLERELRGEDVPGANDNASGVGACLALAQRLATEPLDSTRVVILATGAEEAGVLGMRRFLDREDTGDWLFLNFDGVGADAPLRYLRVEGGPLAARRADPEMVALAERIGRELPVLGLSACDHGSGLPYDATAVMARGGRALTIGCQGRAIPDYHWPTDRPAAIEPASLGRAIRLAQEMLAGIDRGESDRAG